MYKRFEDCADCQRLWGEHQTLVNKHQELENHLRSASRSDAPAVARLAGELKVTEALRTAARASIIRHEIAHATEVADA